MRKLIPLNHSAFVASTIVAMLWTSVNVSSAELDSPNYSKDIASFIYSRCTTCHRPGQSGPFALQSYDDVKTHADTIAKALEEKYMPPWKPIDCGIPFTNDRRATDEEIRVFRKWVEADCPEGDPTLAPSTPTYPDGWRLGTPDLIVRMDQPFPVPADGPDIYRSFVLPVGASEDRWIKAMELRPQARESVHHVLFFVDETGKAKTVQSRDGQPGFAGMNFMRGLGGSLLERGSDQFTRGLGGYVPGAMPTPLPDDLARFLPKGSDIIMQTHFHPNGKPEIEQAELGIYFADQPPSQRIVPIQLPALFGIAAGIDIPAGKKDFRIKDSFVLPIDVEGIEIGGHAHYICSKMVMKATLPDGVEKTLLRIDDWDLDWQDQYQFAERIDLPKGTVLYVEIEYDNSKNNPENPFTPPQRITWGRESTDEMGSITLIAVAKHEEERKILEAEIRERTRKSIADRIRSQSAGLAAIAGSGFGRGGLLKLFDRNQDGQLQASEVPERFRDRVFDFMDNNSDGTLDKAELEAGRKSIEKLLAE